MKTSMFAAVLVLVCCSPSFLQAAIMYGDYTGDSVMYLDVTESNAADEEKFGAPDIFGKELKFNPTSFRSQSAGPEAIESSQLSMTIMSASNAPMGQILFEESGDYTLSGLGAAQAAATVSASVQFTITQINNGQDVMNCQGTDQLVFTPDANGEFMLPGDRGTATPWSGSLAYDVAALLESCGFGGAAATKVDVVLDNTLTASAADGGAAFIAKKDLRVLPIFVPEPSSGLLLGVGAWFGTVIIRRRSRLAAC